MDDYHDEGASWCECWRCKQARAGIGSIASNAAPPAPAPAGELDMLDMEEICRKRREREAQTDAKVIVDQAARIAALEAEKRRLVDAVKGLLKFEEDVAGWCGMPDCTCANRSREYDLAYENGNCPHQGARAALARASKGD